MVDTNGSWPIAGRRAEGNVLLDDFFPASVVLFDPQYLVLRSFGQVKPVLKGRQFEDVVDKRPFGDGDAVSSVVIGALNVIEIGIRPVDVFVSVIQGDTPGIDDLVADQHGPSRPVQKGALELRLRAPVGEEEKAFGRIDGDAAWVLQVAIDDGDAGGAVRRAKEDAVHDIVDEKPIGAQPIKGHLFDVVETLRKGDGPLDGRIGYGGALEGAERSGVGRRGKLFIGLGGDPTDGSVPMIDIHGADGVAFEREFLLQVVAVQCGG